MTNEKTLTQLNFSDIQGYIIRGYNMNNVRHFVLYIKDAKGAKKFIGSLVSGSDESIPQITTAAWWDIKPSYCLNIGFTFEGLNALQFVADIGKSFSGSNYKSFRQGAIAQATQVGDIGESVPEKWKGGLGTSNTHVLLSLYAQDSKVLEQQSDKLRSLFKEGDALKELSCFDGAKLPDEKGQPSDIVHFGYKDGISQPKIEGVPTKRGLSKSLDPQPIIPAYEFILLDDEKAPYYVPTPPELGLNGSFAAFRVLEQDVAGFEKFLQEQKDKIDSDKLAAKMCGRWRNGVPLDLSPDADQLTSPKESIIYEQFNNFDYSDDPQGYKCPIGSHIRRTNPRAAKIQGVTNIHRLIRRGIPYGSLYNPNSPNDGIERGLLGLFICVNLKRQFEFVMEEWVNKGDFAGLPTDVKAPLIGANDNKSGQFDIPVSPDNPSIKLTGFDRFITTKGGAYCFIPSITALQHIASHSTK
ncbi:Dyp-type peroxidase [Nostoc sp. ATCC 53789]|uniref:Dyp-type peroxidase n=1 Tax=Nostoc sp. ATCC 53789 TaxID=76335 RepID=UPI000DECD04E|nr:Dyp-type peroxidase [Nostoc sp. ATCC 53789]QHG14892.1 Dyp-type peroxidase [Nostoc sp. ATCC 53789]RCJ20571.1 peroxidase [Nostoc sp. ATCC 53789]